MTRWYKALGARGPNTLVHAMDHEGGPDADATCPNCLARIAAATALGPAGLATSRIRPA